MTEFERCRPWIEAALAGCKLTPDEVADGLRDGLYVLFSDADAALVAEFVFSPRSKALHVFAGGGSLEGIERLIPIAEEFARHAGCDSAGASGRKGWLRWLKKYGYAPGGALVKEL